MMIPIKIMVTTSMIIVITPITIVPIAFVMVTATIFIVTTIQW